MRMTSAWGRCRMGECGHRHRMQAWRIPRAAPGQSIPGDASDDSVGKMGDQLVREMVGRQGPQMACQCAHLGALG